MVKMWLRILRVLVIFLVVSIAFFEWMFWNNLTVRTYEIRTDAVTARVRIAVLADFHNSDYGTALVDALTKAAPDIVVIPGDLDSSGVYNENVRALLSAIGRAYPCYYVTGNHEFWTGCVEEIMDMVRASGATVLRGDSALVTANGQTLRLAGVDDPDGLISTDWSAQLGACAPNDDIYAILLSHRPERGALYRDAGFDLALVGHAHGGQVRLPLLLNGLYAPNQGWFPKHAGGRYEIGDMTMIVSRGLQNWGLPRVFNPPEMVLVDIVPE